MATGFASTDAFSTADQPRQSQPSQQPQLQPQASTSASSGTKTTTFAMEPKTITQSTAFSSTFVKDSTKQPSIFLSKKPTAASTGSRPLLKPFARSVDYSHQGKLGPEPPKPVRGTPISLPGLTPTSSSLVSRPATAPFVFDNHTTYDESGSEDSTQNDLPETSNKPRSEVDLPTASKGHSALTILRIKRKRNEEPLDTLVVQEHENAATKKQKKLNDRSHDPTLRRTKDIMTTKAQPAVFRLATTVNTESFKDPAHSIQLREKITHLTETSRPRPRPSDRHTQEFEDRIHQRRGQLVQGKQEETRTARYRVVNKNRTGLQQTPPQVKSSVEAEAEAILDVFKMYDAVKEDDSKAAKQHAQTSEESDIMCNFLPMVREYLSISDKVVDPMTTFEMPSGTSSLATDSKEDTVNDEDDYVYDIYYCDPHADHHQEVRHRTIGALLWCSDDENDFIHDDSSEYGDDDSDSNAEDYYRNDYPDEELSEDEYHYELSDTDDEYLY